jgi:23S rRNA pseudouridine955/2504/2580 synthase/23S rRNA pseudouridine1911/1915/1917 synthase
MNQLEIIFEDDDLIVINKQPGTLSIPDRYQASLYNLKNALEEKFGDIFVVHRIDKFTSGAICFAKNEETHQALNLQFQERKVSKTYHLFVSGQPQDNEGTITAPILKGQDNRVQIHKRGKVSISEYKVLKRYKYHSKLQFDLLTGRTHQARVHAAHIGCPLLVDPVYGNKSEFYLSEIKKNYKLNRNGIERPLVTRTPLHARELGFTHPNSKRAVSFIAEYPKDLKALEKQLDKWSSIANQ